LWSIEYDNIFWMPKKFSLRVPVTTSNWLLTSLAITKIETLIVLPKTVF